MGRRKARRIGRRTQEVQRAESRKIRSEVVCPQVMAVEGLFAETNEGPRCSARAAPPARQPTSRAPGGCHNPDCDDSKMEDAHFGPARNALECIDPELSAASARGLNPEPYEPFAVGLVDLPNGLRVLGASLSDDPQSVEVGSEVELVIAPWGRTRRQDVISWQFKPILANREHEREARQGLVSSARAGDETDGGERDERGRRTRARNASLGQVPGEVRHRHLPHAVEAALADAGVKWRQVEAVAAASSRFSGGKGWGLNGNDIVEDMGSTGIPVYNLSAGCAAGANAFNVGYTLVASGMHDVVLVVGGEKMPKGFIQTSGLDDETDPEYLRQRCIGLPGPGFWALLCAASAWRSTAPPKRTSPDRGEGPQAGRPQRERPLPQGVQPGRRAEVRDGELPAAPVRNLPGERRRRRGVLCSAEYVAQEGHRARSGCLERGGHGALRRRHPARPRLYRPRAAAPITARRAIAVGKAMESAGVGPRTSI